ncbi:MAG: hypothetical protein MUF43_00240 [Flavobacterium sp.]|nr:hypothetical protein [Flavobacterium sp.]
MKKIFYLLACIMLFSSCFPTDDEPRFNLELLPIQSVEVPESFVLGQTYTITVRYFRPTSCHFYDGIHYQRDLNIRVFAIRSAVQQIDTCANLDQVLVEETFEFYVTSNGSYIFKFWQGVNDAGENVFLEYEIPVID